MLIAGSYERFLFGLGCGNEQAPVLSSAFTFPAHKGPVKCVTAASPFVASGGADDTVHLYNFQTNTDLGFLMSPGDGAVSAIRFFAPAHGAAPSHLLSGSADGSVSIWAASADWDCLKTLPGHKKEVCGLAVHPSGRLALSTARDGVLRMWNLVKGRCQYKTNLAACGEAVEFSPGGASYALACGRQVTVQSVEGGVLATQEQAARTQCLAFLSEQVLALGGADGSVTAWDVRVSAPTLSLPRAHAARIRGLAPLAAAGGDAWALGAASSDGVARLWDMRSAGAGAAAKDAAACVAEARTGARLTCLCAAAPQAGERGMPGNGLAADGDGAPVPRVKRKERRALLQEGEPRRVAGAAGMTAAEAGDSGRDMPSRKEPQGRAGSIGRKGVAEARQAAPAPPAKGVMPPKKKRAAAEGGVVVHDGVVEFLDPPRQDAKRKKGKKKAMRDEST